MSVLKEKLYAHQMKTLMTDEGLSGINGAIVIAIGLIVLLALFSMLPIIGSSIDESTVIVATSNWNATTNEDLTTGVDLWSQTAGLLTLVVIAGIFSFIWCAFMAWTPGKEDY